MNILFKVPCIGFSVGIERIFSIMEAKAKVNMHVVARSDHNFESEH